MTREELRALLAALKLSQARAAKLLGVTTTALEYWVVGKRPVNGSAAKLLRLYHGLLADGWTHGRVAALMEENTQNSS